MFSGPVAKKTATASSGNPPRCRTRVTKAGAASRLRTSVIAWRTGRAILRRLARSALARRLSAITAPLGVEGALFVHTVVGVCTKEVPLRLNQSSRQPLGANAVVIGQR